MPFVYKMDILKALKEKGYNTTRLRREKILSESTIQCFRDNKVVSIETIGVLCDLLDCDLSDLIEYTKE